MMKNTTKFMLSMVATAIALSGSAAFAAEQTEDGIKLGGAVRVNYAYRDYDQANKDKGGDFYFDMAAIKFDGKHGDWGLSAEYRFTSGTDYIKYGYAYYDVNPDWQLQFGINKVPFGNRDFISNSYWFGIPYYLGFEDDHDTGIKAVYEKNGWHTDLAFYKSAEYGPSENKRYSTDLYSGTIAASGIEYFNEETNQFNLRQTYTAEHEGGQTTLGGSVQYGQIYNSNTGNNGDRYAVALHLDSSYKGWNLQLQAMQYEYDAADAVDANKIAVSVVSWQYEIASKGQSYSANIAKTFATDWGSVKCYNDFGLMTPDVDDASYDNSMQNVTGCAISAGPTYTMVDFVMGKNMTFSTANNDHVGLPEMGDSWDKRVNINFGYYF
ncbi:MULTISPECIES: OprO/OprP family phosphate-selective porin [unclassified Shewanella]|uniref:OprO/OprP family phosphate-selective porin n=1 Tax=unclassified Shewanella TaxID=196818 RepID=UPI001C8058F8|nr:MULTISPECIES: OprO/OprP family phosphate-selective porin [unclassified Shewanella]MCG9730381.1 OprO/OprP family phosphate-selective porin [Shewanella sp. Isolate13]